jgi:hypothetical protein
MMMSQLLTNTATQFDKWFQPREKLQGLSLMDHLFNRLDGLYPHKWKSNFQNQEAIDNWMAAWAEAFEESHVTPQQIAQAIRLTKSLYDWPPSIKEFLGMCNPIQDMDKAYYEAIALIAARDMGEAGTYSHPAIYWTAMELRQQLVSGTYSQVMPKFQRALTEQLEAGEWKPVPDPVKLLKAAPRSPRATELATKLVAEATDTIASKMKAKQDVGIDVSWAKKIIERCKNGDRSITITVLHFAEEALGMR